MSLRVDAIGVRFGDRTVLQDVTFEVPTGRTLAIRGRSGLGKTSLLRAISGLIPPTTGTIHVGAVDVTNTPTHRRSIGFVFQDSQLFPHLDVAANIAYGLRVRGDDRNRTKDTVAEWLERIGLSDRAEQRVHTLSGGESRRVALARALAPGPKVLLLDEPFTGLDMAMREKLTTLLRELLVTTGTTTLLVSHDDDDVARIAHEVHRLHEPS